MRPVTGQSLSVTSDNSESVSVPHWALWASYTVHTTKKNVPMHSERKPVKSFPPLLHFNQGWQGKHGDNCEYSHESHQAIKDQHSEKQKETGVLMY